MQRLICSSVAVPERGDGLRFEIGQKGQGEAAFVVRFAGTAHAYLNRCAHVAVELDWNPGKFFDDSGLYLICATHGATYEPDSGLCVGGPCAGRSLQKLPVAEHDGNIYLIENHD